MTSDSAPRPRARAGWLVTLGSWLPSWWRKPEPERQRGALRVLVVDDDPVNLLLIAGPLEARGLAVVQAEDGAEAVALACEMDFDLILMDLHMPVLGGLEATAAIRRFESTSPRRAVPVVAYSSTLPGAQVLAAHGLDGSLTKPCDGPALDDCLARWCPTHRPATGLAAPP